MLRVVFLRADPPDETMPPTSSEWLCSVPASALQRHGWDVRIRASYEVHTEHSLLDWADIIIVERSAFSVSELAVSIWRNRGKRVLLRFDDAYGLMPDFSQSYDMWNVLNIRGVLAYDRFVQSFPLFDSYSTPSRVLVNDYLELADGIYIPNRPDLTVFPQPETFRSGHHFLNIAWGGSIPHRQSWENSGAADAINKLVGKNESFRLCLLCQRDWFPKLFHVPYIAYQWTPIHKYRLRLRRIADIGLAPLAGEYDERRSWIKVLVYALLGIPWVASNVGPYKECKGGILVDNEADAWIEAISRMLDDGFRL